MARTVENQLKLFTQVHERAAAMWLSERWDQFREGSQGRLDAFLDEVRQSQSLSIFVPTRSMRQLSANNPYAAAAGQSGFYEEVEPSKMAARLARSREELAAAWMCTLDDLSINVDWDAGTLRSGGSGGRTSQPLRGDGQLLLGMATRIAVRDVLQELLLLPSQRHVYTWLHDFCLLSHAVDLTREGSVEKLLLDLGAQPLHIRGGTLVDPMQIEKDLVRRTSEITTDMADLLRDTLEDESLHNNFLWRTTSVGSDDLHANLLERCFNL